MGAPYKMKYTKKGKADPTAFPFNTASNELAGVDQQATQEAMKKKIDKVVEKKVDTAIDPETI
jgi:hypothetical protein|tara:strand:- start:301 stop:489 length:189 start_codon:yes stop_codon:yes gene_type:complete